LGGCLARRIRASPDTRFPFAKAFLLLEMAPAVD
jgi:hypothetical protein